MPVGKEKDITEKTLENCDDVFADIVNAVVFGGREIVRPEELIDAVATSQMKLSDGLLHEQERDTAKFWHDREIRLALWGLENMTKPERDLVLRAFSYDSATYREQVNDRISARRAHQPPRPVYPAITIVLYFGTQPWTAPRTLRECLEVEVPPELLELLPDYRLHVVELARLSPEQVEAFRSDFFLPVYYLNNPESDPPEDRSIRHVDETLKLMTAITGDPWYVNEGVALAAEEKEDHVKMSNMFLRAQARCEEIGEARGITIGEARGEARGITIGEARGRAERDALRAEIAELRRRLAQREAAE